MSGVKPNSSNTSTGAIQLKEVKQSDSFSILLVAFPENEKLAKPSDNAYYPRKKKGTSFIN